MALELSFVNDKSSFAKASIIMTHFQPSQDILRTFVPLRQSQQIQDTKSCHSGHESQDQTNISGLENNKLDQLERSRKESEEEWSTDERAQEIGVKKFRGIARRRISILIIVINKTKADYAR